MIESVVLNLNVSSWICSRTRMLEGSLSSFNNNFAF